MRTGTESVWRRKGRDPGEPRAAHSHSLPQLRVEKARAHAPHPVVFIRALP